MLRSAIWNIYATKETSCCIGLHQRPTMMNPRLRKSDEPLRRHTRTYRLVVRTPWRM